MQIVLNTYDRAVGLISGKGAESIMLLATRVALGGVFWRSGRTKIEDGTLLSISENTIFQFQDDPFNKLPLLPPELAAHITAYAEHAFPILLVAGLFTRLSALALLVMTMVIQIFIFPDAWWPVHSLWVAMALVLIVRGGGVLSLDNLIAGRRG